jgi:hypothetical protein
MNNEFFLPHKNLRLRSFPLNASLSPLRICSIFSNYHPLSILKPIPYRNLLVKIGILRKSDVFTH